MFGYLLVALLLLLMPFMLVLRGVALNRAVFTRAAASGGVLDGDVSTKGRGETLIVAGTWLMLAPIAYLSLLVWLADSLTMP